MISLTNSDEVKRIYIEMKRDLFKHSLSDDKRIIYGFKESKKMLEEWARTLPKEKLTALNNILLSKFNKKIDLSSKEIGGILKRNRIRNDEEFRTIEEKVSEICQTNPKSPELEKLNHLLLVYEQINKKH